MINIFKSDFRSPIGKLFRLPLKLIPAKTVLPILQGKLKGKNGSKAAVLMAAGLVLMSLISRLYLKNMLKQVW